MGKEAHSYFYNILLVGKEAHLYLCNILRMGREACLYNKIKYHSHNKIQIIGLFSRGLIIDRGGLCSGFYGS